MSTKTIEAKAVISAQDKTGAVFDNLAKKFKGVAKDAKALADIKPPKLSGDFFEKELSRLKLTQREMAGVQREFQALHKSISAIGPVHPAQYMKQIDDWRGRTITHWRDVKARIEEAHSAHEKYAAREKVFHRAAHSGLHNVAHIVGIGGGAYAGAHVVREIGKMAGERNREDIREDIAGFSPEEKEEAQGVADYISRKYPSISRTEAMEDLRKNASRLGSFGRAKEIAQDYARAKIMNRISGGDEHELEQVVRAAEGAGAANTGEQFRNFINAFSKAKAANPDYTGEQFRSDMAAASSAKYGLSKDYMENVFPILASHTSGFGNKLSTGLSAMVGGRMTSQARKTLEADGLMKKGNLIDKEGWIADNFEWTQKHIRPLLEKQGIHFGEEMSEEDKGKVVAWLAKRFSARNAADLVGTNLLDQPLVEKARKRQVKNIESADDVQKKDGAIALEGVTKQLGDLGVAATNTSFAIGTMNSAAIAMANMTHWLQTGEVPPDSRGGRFLKWLKHDTDPVWGPMPEADQSGARTTLPISIDDTQKASMLHTAAKTYMRSGPFETDTSMPGFLGGDVSLAEAMKKADSAQYWKGVPLPGQRPFDRYQSPTTLDGSTSGALQQVQLTGSAAVTGEAKLTVEAGSSLLQIVEQMQHVIKLAGTFSANGPGGTGKSSPDAKPNPFPGY